MATSVKDALRDWIRRESKLGNPTLERAVCRARSRSSPSACRRRKTARSTTSRRSRLTALSR
jgi:hypothetical protein